FCGACGRPVWKYRPGSQYFHNDQRIGFDNLRSSRWNYSERLLVPIIKCRKVQVISGGDGFYGYSFEPSLTDGIPVSSHNDYFRVVGGRVAGLDTLTITSVDYDLDVASVVTEVDTAVFTINISSAESAIEADSVLYVEIRDFLNMPFEATNGGDAPVGFLNTGAASGDYDILVEIQAPDGSLISTSNEGGYSANRGNASTYMVLVNGQQHNPGALLQAGAGIIGAPTATTVGTGVSFVVLAVDQYGNIDQAVNNNEYVNIETAHGGIQELATLRHAPDDNAGADGDLTFTSGSAQYAEADSFRFHKAGDGVAALSTTDIDRSVYKSIIASQAGGSRSGTSENISVANDAAENALVLIPGETYVAGDSASQGKTDTGQELSANGTYTITVYPVDQYYNRTDSTFSGAEVLSITTSGGAVTLIPTDGDTSFSSSAVATFTVKPTAAGTDTINVTITSGAFTAAGQASFDVIAAVATAVFDAFASDSTEVSGRIMPYTVNLAFPGTFEDGGGWSVYLFGDSNITTVTQEPGIQELVSGITTGEGTSTPAAYSANANVAVNTNEGEEYYLFAALPEVSNQIVGKSGGFIMLHQPVVDTDITKVTPSDMDSVLNSGGDNDPLTDPQKAVNIEFAVIDADQGPAEVDVYIFLHEENDLTKDDYVAGDIQLDGTNGILISSDLDESDTVFDFDITDALPGGEPRAPAGDYYVYVVAYDQKNANIGVSDNVLTVKHAPNITLDRPANGVTPINTSSQHIFTFSWAVGTATDVDDPATIAIYLDSVSTKHALPSQVVGSATSIDLTGGFTLEEESTEDVFILDLRDLDEEDLPVEGVAYDAYALIKDNSDTVMYVSTVDAQLQFTHDPSFTFMFNLGAGLSKGEAASQVNVDNGEVFQVRWDAFDLDDEQFIRLVVSQRDSNQADWDDLTFGTDAWIMNSTDGTAGVNDVNVTQLSTTDDTYFNWFSENMEGLDDNGNYYIYAYVTDDGNDLAWSTAKTVRFRSRGKVLLTGQERSTTRSYDIRTSPSVVSAAKGEEVTVEVLLNSDGVSINHFGIFLDVDTSLFDIKTPSTPFTYTGSDFLGSETPIQNSVTESGGKWLVNFEKVVPAGSGSAVSSESIGEIVLVGRENSTAGTVEGDVVFSNDEDNNRSTFIATGTGPTSSVYPNPAIRVYKNPLGQLRGFVQMQGRTDHTLNVEGDRLTLELREIGSYNPISDASYIASNDVNEALDGVQVDTDNFGSYVLRNVPSGTYYLVAKTQSYLTGQYPSFTILSGDIIQDANPTYDNDAIPNDLAELRGGDVSSGSAPGTGDNIVGDEDVTYLITRIVNGETDVVLDYPQYAVGDVDNSGIIASEDLFIANSNYGLEGIPPVFSKGAGGTNAAAKLALEGVPETAFENEEFEIKVWARGVDDLFGYDYTLVYDKSKLELVDDGIEEGGFMATRPGFSETVFFTKSTARGTKVISGLKGQGDGYVAGDGVITRLRFRSRVQDERPAVELVSVKLANSDADIQRLSDVRPVPEKFHLSQNYPNPFNPETKIRFQLPRNAHVSLKVYNILGQEVATLVNRDMESGFHSLNWNGRNNAGVRVASGVYIYELRTAEFSMAKKMLLIK
ncbi:FlgD immunoglobulin-like domain containing protein, partial [candidate division KSB1 bacterium]